MNNKCIICGYNKSDKCHIKSRGAGGSNDDFNILYMCRTHHIEQHKIGWKKLCNKYPIVEKILFQKGWILINIFGVWKLRRKDE